MSLYHQAAALLVTFIWGTNFVLIRHALDELEPFTLAALRFFFVAFPLIFFLPKPKVKWRFIVAYGLLIGVGQFGLLFWAMQGDITPGLASLLIQLQVFFTVLLTVATLKEAVSPQQSVAMLGELSWPNSYYPQYKRSDDYYRGLDCSRCRYELGERQPCYQTHWQR